MYIQQKKDRALLIVIVAVMTTAIIFCIVATAKTNEAVNNTEWRKVTYTVAKGDTLWSIAYDYAPDYYPVREYIDLLKYENFISDGTIYAGQRITILIEEE